MGKKTNYFSHDSNARNDEKILALRIKFGAEGYGIFFMLLERLREETNYMCVKDYNLLAFDLRVNSSVLKSTVEDFGLFAFTEDGKCFYSDSFKERMNLKDIVSSKARESVNKRWEKQNAPNNDTNVSKEYTNVLRMNNKTDTSKGKESKEEELYPTDVGESDSISDYKSVEKTKKGIFDFLKTKPKDIQPYVDFWNLFAKEKKLPEIKVINKNRKKKFNVRIREEAFDFGNILRKAGQSEFLLTGTWFGFDWVIENDSNYLKILEGNYDNKQKNESTTNEAKKKLEEFQRVAQRQRDLAD